MACGATLSLKRSLEFDPVHSPNSRSPKRRRCGATMNLSPSTPPSKSSNPSAFTEATPKLMTSDQIAAQALIELKRMQRRKQLGFQSMSPSSSPPHSGSNTPPHPSQSSHLHPAELAAGPSQMNYSPSASATLLYNPMSPGRRDLPLFTLKQVSMVCERMLKEREAAIKQEYDKVLSSKLAEQYEAFLKFNHDQLARRFRGEAAASYVS